MINLRIIHFIFLLFIRYSKSQIQEIQSSNYSTISFSGSKKLLLFINIEKLPLKEDGIITIKTNSLNPIENFQIRYKFSNIKPVSESDFINLKSYYHLEKSELSDYFYHLYFRKTEQANFIYFEITISNEGNKFISYVYTASRITNIKPTEEYYNTLNMKEGIPIFQKIYIECEPFLYPNYLITSNSNDMSIIEGDLLSTNKKIIKHTIFLHKIDKNCVKGEKQSFYLKFFGFNEYMFLNVFFGVKNLDTVIKVKHFDYRKNLEILNFEITNTFKPAYFIGQYIFKSNETFWIEPIVGNVISYYTNTINGPEFDNIFPNENRGQKVNKNYIRVYSDTDIFSFYCKSYCYFNLYALYQNQGQVTGLLYYFLVSKDEPKEMNIDNNEENYNQMIQIQNVNKKKIDVTISFHTEHLKTFHLNKENDIVYYRFTEKIDVNVKIESYQEESLVIINKFISNLCTIYTEQITKPSNVYKMCGIFYFPQNKYSYDKFILEFKNNNTKPSFTMGILRKNASFVPANALLLDDEELKDNNKIEIKNPYIHTLPSSIDKDTRFYIIVYFSETDKGDFKNGLTYLYKQKKYDSQYRHINYPFYVSNEVEFRLVRNFMPNKKLVIIVSKVGNSLMELNLKVDEYIVKKELLENQFSIFYYDDYGVSISLSITKGNPGDGAFVYYNYVSESEIEDFKVNYNFHITHTYNEKTNRTFLLFNSPYSQKLIDKKKFKVRYRIYIKTINDTNTTNNISQIRKYKLFKKIETDEHILTFNITLNRNYDYSIFVTARIVEKFSSIRPLFFYPNVKLNKIIQIKQQNYSSAFFIISIILLVNLFIILYLVYNFRPNIAQLSKKKEKDYTVLVSKI